LQLPKLIARGLSDARVHFPRRLRRSVHHHVENDCTTYANGGTVSTSHPLYVEHRTWDVSRTYIYEDFDMSAIIYGIPANVPIVVQVSFEVFPLGRSEYSWADVDFLSGEGFGFHVPSVCITVGPDPVII